MNDQDRLISPRWLRQTNRENMTFKPTAAMPHMLKTIALAPLLLLLILLPLPTTTTTTTTSATKTTTTTTETDHQLIVQSLPQEKSLTSTLPLEPQVIAGEQQQQPLDGEQNVFGKITFIVGAEAEQQQQQLPALGSGSNGSQQLASDCRDDIDNKEKPKSQKQQKLTQTEAPNFHELNESTKLIYIDATNEFGYLTGEVGSNEQRGQLRAAQVLASDDNYSESGGGGGGDLATTTNKATNYSVFLVSRNKEHIALLLDIEQLDFEPIINCENQELRLSIVGEISKQLLLNKKANQTAAAAASGTGELVDDSSGVGGEQAAAQVGELSDNVTADLSGEAQNDSPSTTSQTSPQSSQSLPPPLPVSEAMAMLLNSPLNKTILDQSEETNDFKIIDSTIDYLHQETCLTLISSEQQQQLQQQQQQLMKQVQQRTRLGSKSSTKRKQSPRKSRRLRAPKRTALPKQVTDSLNGGGGGGGCPYESDQFKELMVSKLNDYFEWDDFKIVCGKTRQLLIPMRSLKLSVYSDEFSPNSRFIIKYQFISDPKLLPSQDSGKYYCRNRNVIDLQLKCDGIDDCGDASDESIKLCGYPTNGGVGRASSSTTASVSTIRTVQQQEQQQQQQPQNDSTQPSNTQHHQPSKAVNKQRLTYVSGEVLHCCQSSDWLSLVPQQQQQNNNQLNLQSLIGDSMNLFSGPIFAPTTSTTNRRKAHRRHKRIVGGGVAPKGAWPAQASLQYELLEPLCHFCAGTLIHPQYVLTAGHCITKDGLGRGIKVVFGAHDLRQLDTGSHIQVRYVDEAQIYPGVDVKQLSFDWENDMNNDIALLRLNAPVQITPHVAPACLPPFNTPLAVNTTCRSIGWGQTHGSGSSNMLKHLSLKVVDSTLCSKELFDKDDKIVNKTTSGSLKQNRFKQLKTQPIGNGSGKKRGRFVSDFEYSSLDQYSDLTMVCVNNDLGHGICQGDSGGPLYCERQTANGEHCTEIYGVASFIIQYATVGAMCAVENLPGIFGEVSSKTEWISSTMKMFEQTYRLKYS